MDTTKDNPMPFGDGTTKPLCKCGDPKEHGHLSLPDPPGTTRIEIIKDKLASMIS